MEKNEESVEIIEGETQGFTLEIAYELLEKIGIHDEEDILVILIDNELRIRCRSKNSN